MNIYVEEVDFDWVSQDEELHRDLVVSFRAEVNLFYFELYFSIRSEQFLIIFEILILLLDQFFSRVWSSLHIISVLVFQFKGVMGHERGQKQTIESFLVIEGHFEDLFGEVYGIEIWYWNDEITAGFDEGVFFWPGARTFEEDVVYFIEETVDDLFMKGGSFFWVDYVVSDHFQEIGVENRFMISPHDLLHPPFLVYFHQVKVVGHHFEEEVFVRGDKELVRGH